MRQRREAGGLGAGAREHAVERPDRAAEPVATGSIGTSIPASSMIAAVNSYHEHAPAFVRCSSPPTPRSEAWTSAAARSLVAVGVSRWSATIRSGRGDSRARPIIRTTKLPPFDALPCSPYSPPVRTTSTSGAYASAACSPASLLRP